MQHHRWLGQVKSEATRWHGQYVVQDMAIFHRGTGWSRLPEARPAGRLGRLKTAHRHRQSLQLLADQQRQLVWLAEQRSAAMRVGVAHDHGRWLDGQLWAVRELHQDLAIRELCAATKEMGVVVSTAMCEYWTQQSEPPPIATTLKLHSSMKTSNFQNPKQLSRFYSTYLSQILMQLLNISLHTRQYWINIILTNLLWQKHKVSGIWCAYQNEFGIFAFQISQRLAI